MSDRSLREYQRNFILFVIYREQSRQPGKRVTASVLREKLLGVNVIRQFDYDGIAVSSLLESLIRGGYVQEHKRSKGASTSYPAPTASYALTQQGNELLF